MGSFTKLVRFKAEDGGVYFIDLGDIASDAPAPGSKVTAYKSFDALLSKSDGEAVTVKELLAPLPLDTSNIYCVGLNYKSHANEASIELSEAPPLWVKPPMALANPDQDIVLNKYCASSAPDYEAELVFVTSKTCKDLTESEAEDAILGYTIGNDLSCRFFQLPKQSSGQFFYAKAFDNFAPMGPTLVSKEAFPFSTAQMVLTVNGEQRQQAKFEGDLVFSPAKILSFMSQGTTIPAYTAVMTGTPSGVGAFMNPKQFLKHGDEIKITVTGIGELRNKIVVEQ